MKMERKDKYNIKNIFTKIVFSYHGRNLQKTTTRMVQNVEKWHRNNEDLWWFRGMAESEYVCFVGRE